MPIFILLTPVGQQPHLLAVWSRKTRALHQPVRRTLQSFKPRLTAAAEIAIIDDEYCGLILIQDFSQTRQTFLRRWPTLCQSGVIGNEGFAIEYDPVWFSMLP